MTGSLFFLVLGCTVKLSEDTVGAKKSCNPDINELTDFQCTAYHETLAKQEVNCTGCHSPGSAGSGAFAFDLNSRNDCQTPTTDAEIAAVKTNYCIVFLRAGTIETFPQTQAHADVANTRIFSATEMAPLVTWINENVQPTR